MMNRKYITPAFIMGEKISKVRKQLGMTQKAFAEFVGVSKPTIERWERGREPISGPIVLLLEILTRHPETEKAFSVPEKSAPIRLWYYHEETVCSIIDVDEVKRSVLVYNYTDNVVFRAFGRNEHPSYEDYLAFLESRCFPRERDKMKLMLKELDLPFYDPFMIIEKTGGRMAEDGFHIQIER